MFGNKVANVNVNMPVRNILPQSIRKFEQPLDRGALGNRMLFGRYKADLKVTYGSDKQVLTKSIEFWVIPYRLIILGIVVLIIVFFVLQKSESDVTTNTSSKNHKNANKSLKISVI